MTLKNSSTTTATGEAKRLGPDSPNALNFAVAIRGASSSLILIAGRDLRQP